MNEFILGNEEQIQKDNEGEYLMREQFETDLKKLYIELDEPPGKLLSYCEEKAKENG